MNVLHYHSVNMAAVLYTALMAAGAIQAAHIIGEGRLYGVHGQVYGQVCQQNLLH